MLTGKLNYVYNCSSGQWLSGLNYVVLYKDILFVSCVDGIYRWNITDRSLGYVYTGNYGSTFRMVGVHNNMLYASMVSAGNMNGIYRWNITNFISPDIVCVTTTGTASRTLSYSTSASAHTATRDIPLLHLSTIFSHCVVRWGISICRPTYYDIYNYRIYIWCRPTHSINSNVLPLEKVYIFRYS